MSDMQFQSDDPNEFVRQSPSSSFDLSGMLVSWGLASSRQQAEYILLGVGVVCILIAGYFFWPSGGGDTRGQPIYNDPSTVRVY